jgi:alkylhydroperoxidase family enzyme
MLSLLSIDESARLGEKPGIDPGLATSNVFRGLLHNPSAAAGFYAVVDALMFRNKVAARTRELIILRIGWRTASEYVFCNHVRISRGLGIPDEEILGVRDPQRCRAYSKTDRALIDFADELHECAEVTRSTWVVLEKAFACDELVELLLIAGFWRMARGSTCGSIVAHCRSQYRRTPSRPSTQPPSQPFGQLTSGCIVARAPSRSRALKAA